MAIPAIPSNFYIQQGNGDVLLSWDIMAGALSYAVTRSTDGVTYASLGTATTNQYLDSTPTINTLYYYKVASVNGSGTSSYTSGLSVIPTRTGDMSLGQLRLTSQQRADRVNSQFLTTSEWNSNINQSAFELYDLLTTLYEDYYVTSPYEFTTTGNTSQYTLPNDFYKLLGVDCGLNASNNAWVTLKKFNFIDRNKYVYPQLTANALGIFNLSYRLVGNTLMLIPQPAGSQQVRAWYIPKMTQMLQDTDILVGVSGWTEYVIVDAAIKALQKEESDVSVLMAQKMALLKRIEETAMNRDAGQPDTISDTRLQTNMSGWGGFGGPYGGF